MLDIRFTKLAYERYRERALGDPLREQRSCDEIRGIIQRSLEGHRDYARLEKMTFRRCELRLGLLDSTDSSLGTCTLVLTRRPHSKQYEATSVM